MKHLYTKQSLKNTLLALAILSIGVSIGLWGKPFFNTSLINNHTLPSKLIISANKALCKRDCNKAFNLYLKALSSLPFIQKILYGLAKTSAHEELHELSSAFLKIIHTLDKKNPITQLALAQSFLHLKEREKAIHYLKNLKLPLPDKLTLTSSKLFLEAGLLQEALSSAERALKIDSNNALAWATIGNIYNRLGELDNSVISYKKALSLKASTPNVIYNLGYTLKRLGRLEEALIYFNRAIELKPGYLDALIDRAYTYWALGDFEKAWQDYAWRFKMHNYDPTTTLNIPLWDGRDLKNKTILLYAEQGLGDTLQFIRLAESVKKKGNPKILCRVQKPLRKLLQSYPSIDQFVNTYETKNVDYQAPLMSLPGILKLTPTTIPAPKKYLFANKKLKDKWQKKLENSSHDFRVGLCWHVDPIHEKTKSPFSLRSVDLKDFLPLGNIPNVSFYALQQGKGLEEINNLPESFNLTAFDHFFDKRHGSFMDSAAVIANLDLVITVDTAIAHLAGALGKKVWILLPFAPDGRWSLNTAETPWYRTATLFRQTTPHNWKAPLENIQKELQQIAAKKKNSLT